MKNNRFQAAALVAAIALAGCGNEGLRVEPARCADGHREWVVTCMKDHDMWDCLDLSIPLYCGTSCYRAAWETRIYCTVTVPSTDQENHVTR